MKHHYKDFKFKNDDEFVETIKSYFDQNQKYLFKSSKYNELKSIKIDRAFLSIDDKNYSIKNFKIHVNFNCDKLKSNCYSIGLEDLCYLPPKSAV